MRFTSLLGAAFIASAFATGAACGIFGNTENCNCPLGTVWPSVVVNLPCGTTQLPTMNLSGVCAGQGGEQSGKLVFGAKEPGTCHVELVYADGSSFSTDVTFTGEWLACGSDPHGCGERVSPDGLPLEGIFAVLVAGASCDGGTSATAMDADAGVEAAATMAGIDAGMDAPDAFWTSLVPCGPLTCSAPTQYCSGVFPGTTIPFNDSGSIVEYACNATPAACVSNPRCACIASDAEAPCGPSASSFEIGVFCFDEDGGGVSLMCAYP
jgi:hypothetical protein